MPITRKGLRTWFVPLPPPPPLPSIRQSGPLHAAVGHRSRKWKIISSTLISPLVPRKRFLYTRAIKKMCVLWMGRQTCVCVKCRVLNKRKTWGRKHGGILLILGETCLCAWVSFRLVCFSLLLHVFSPVGDRSIKFPFSGSHGIYFRSAGSTLQLLPMGWCTGTFFARRKRSV